MITSEGLTRRFALVAVICFVYTLGNEYEADKCKPNQIDKPVNIAGHVALLKGFLQKVDAYNSQNEHIFRNYNLTLKMKVVESSETPSGLQQQTTELRVSEIFNKLTYTLRENTNNVVTTDSVVGDAVKFGKPRNCEDIQSSFGETPVNGVFTIYPNQAGCGGNEQGNGVSAYCDFTTDGGGWTVIQRRVDKTNFERSWSQYLSGFGNLSGSHWLGLHTIHALTKDGDSGLRIELEDWEGNTRYATYSFFGVSGYEDRFRMRIFDYAGDAGDAMNNHDGQMFSTIDKDNDSATDFCADKFRGGWWYSGCHHANLNGRYLNGNHTSYADGVNWYQWGGYHYSYKRVEMKVRRGSSMF